MASMESESEHLDIAKYCDGRHRARWIRKTADRYNVEICRIDKMHEVEVAKGLSRQQANDIVRKIHHLDLVVG